MCLMDYSGNGSFSKYLIKCWDLAGLDAQNLPAYALFPLKIQFKNVFHPAGTFFLSFSPICLFEILKHN